MMDEYIPVIFQVAPLLAALAHPGHSDHIVIYTPGDSSRSILKSTGYIINWNFYYSPKIIFLLIISIIFSVKTQLTVYFLIF
ncbi:hypothetical protein EAE89_11525 [Photorhabdus heterorhabditis]|nr:hypothetical protein [Photorhabdus heterorhabditis]